jgi:hypothetical protein
MSGAREVIAEAIMPMLTQPARAKEAAEAAIGALISAGFVIYAERVGMRISGSRIDPDYWRNHFAKCPKIFLDGVLVDGDVIEADEERGLVVVEVWENGFPKLNKDGSFMRRTLTGKVRFG